MVDDENVSENSVHLKEDTRAVLRAVYEADGQVTTTSKIKQRTGLDNQKILYRLRDSSDALEGYGFVSVSQVPESEYHGQGMPPKRVELTQKGRVAVEEGKVGDVFGDEQVSDEVEVSREQLESFQDELGRIQNRLNSLVNEGVGGEDSGGDVSEVRELAAEARDEVRQVNDMMDQFQERLAKTRRNQRDLIEGFDEMQEDMDEMEVLVYTDLMPRVAVLMDVLRDEYDGLEERFEQMKERSRNKYDVDEDSNESAESEDEGESERVQSEGKAGGDENGGDASDEGAELEGSDEDDDGGWSSLLS